MPPPFTRPSRSAHLGGAGTARVDRRTKDLTKRLQAGEIAVINHADIDQVAADALVACHPAAVVNAAKSTTGRYPNRGPAIIVDAGIPLVDDVGVDIMTLVSEGSSISVKGNKVLSGEKVLAEGVEQTEATIEADQELARADLNHQLEMFAANTLEYMVKERDLLLDGVGVPDIRTEMEGRHVLVVVRGYHYKEDLATLRPYIREYRPVLIGVDGGADAIMEAGHTPDLIVGDMDSVSDKALTSGAEIIVHAYRNGQAPGAQRVIDLGVTPVVFPATGTSEDIAMLLADDKGAELIVALGTHVTLVEFLDKGRSGMASTFLTRLRVGGKLVDAKGVSRLYRQRISDLQVLALLAAGLAALVVALLATPGGQVFFTIAGGWFKDAWDVVATWFSGD